MTKFIDAQKGGGNTTPNEVFNSILFLVFLNIIFCVIFGFILLHSLAGIKFLQTTMTKYL